MKILDNSDLSELIKRIKAGEKQAFNELFLKLHPSVFYFIYRITFNREAAMDLTQDTFIKFWLNRDNLEPDSSPKAYLFKIAKNISINYKTRRHTFESLDDEEIKKTFAYSHHPDFSSIFVLDDINKAVQMLPEKCRAVYLLSRHEQFSNKEIAEIMEISIQTVKNHISKALVFLRTKLNNYNNYFLIVPFTFLSVYI